MTALQLHLLFIAMTIKFACFQSLYLHRNREIDNITPCTSGLRTNIDRYVFKLTAVYPVYDKAYSYLTFEITRSNDSRYYTLCHVNFGPQCGRFPFYDSCYCDSTDGNGTYYFVVNATGYASYSDWSIRAHWKKNRTYSLYSNEVKLPTIFASNLTMLTVNLIVVRSSPFKLTIPSSDHKVTFCCANSALPCVVMILLNGSVVSLGNNCTTYTLSDYATKTKLNFTFRHAVCGEADESKDIIGIVMNEQRIIV